MSVLDQQVTKQDSNSYVLDPDATDRLNLALSQYQSLIGGKTSMSLTLSISDQSLVSENEKAETGIQHTVRLAEAADQLGYHRFWVSEHHNNSQVAGSSPEALAGYLLAKTNHLRIGSGGVMLQHYSPFKVAETFHVLASLAPGRVNFRRWESAQKVERLNAERCRKINEHHGKVFLKN